MRQKKLYVQTHKSVQILVKKQVRLRKSVISTTLILEQMMKKLLILTKMKYKSTNVLHVNVDG